jgi:hypothetical protein
MPVLPKKEKKERRKEGKGVCLSVSMEDRTL